MYKKELVNIKIFLNMQKIDISFHVLDAIFKPAWQSVSYTISPEGTAKVWWKSNFPVASLDEFGFNFIWKGTNVSVELHFPGSAEYSINGLLMLNMIEQFGVRSHECALDITTAEELCRRVFEKGLPKELRFKDRMLFVDGIPYVDESTYLDGTKEYKYQCLSLDTFEKIRSVWYALTMGFPFPYNVENFEYNGFMGKTLPGFAPYTATFVEWSTDLGVAKMSCSDGQDRLIPTFALGTEIFLPKSNREESVLFGAPSSSN